MDKEKKKESIYKEQLVEEYLFQNLEQADQARKEREYIIKLKKRMDPENLDSMYMLYLKLTEKSYFHTPVGFSFLSELHAYLEENGYRLTERPIPVRNEKKTEADYEKSLRRNYERMSKKLEETEKLLEKMNLVKIRLTIAVIALAVVVTGMIFIAVTNKNTGYFNAEQKVQDKYSYWEEQLDEREKQLQEWEKELEEQAENIQDSKTQN